MSMRMLVVAAIVAVLCISAYVFVSPMSGKKVQISKSLLKKDKERFVMQVPFTRDSCLEISQGVGALGDGIEIGDILMDEGSLKSAIVQILDQRPQVKAIVFIVGISTSNHERVANMLQTIAQARRLEFILFHVNSTYGLEYVHLKTNAPSVNDSPPER